ncbi:MAG TPA: hypothetical protein V6D00_12235 [Pantanalinema sp.]
MKNSSALAATGLVSVLMLGSAPAAFAQHEGHAVTRPGGAIAPGDLARDPADELMRRTSLMGSGTSLQPASSPMWMWQQMTGPWLLRTHGNAVLAWNQGTRPRGTGEPSLANWAMMMGSRILGPGILDLTAMGSLEPATMPPGGTPQLFQTGETYGGRPLIDRQHPHDLFMELSARYTLPLNGRAAAFFYGAPVGEPALGPVAFMHRPSAADNGLAPLGHHLQDSTHITMGVLSAGLQWEHWQVEGSLFRGREPDENRWNLDLGPLDSCSGRLSYAPGPNWALQISSGRLSNPEALEAGDLRRTTASIQHNLPLSRGNWATAMIWGQNTKFGLSPAPITNGLLLESTLDLDRNHLYGRFEAVDKTGLLANLPGGEADERIVRPIQALTLGIIHDLKLQPLVVGIGADATLYAQPGDLVALYGSNPMALRIFLRMRPPLMAHRSSP